MNVSLTPKLEQLVQRKVATGRYGSASEVVREALRLLEERERVRTARLEELRSQLAEGLRDLDQGRRRPFDNRVVEGIKTAGRRRLQRSRKRRS